MNSPGKQWILKLQKRWMVFSALRVLLLALSVALLFSVLLCSVYHWASISFLVILLLTFVLLSYKIRFWAVSEKAVTRFIDQHIAETEESSALLFKPVQELSFLEQLQIQKVNAVLSNQKQPLAPLYQLKMPFVMLAIAALLSLLLIKMPVSVMFQPTQAGIIPSKKLVKEIIPVQISSFNVQIVPPAYTGKGLRSQQQFSLQAESGAQVNWQIKTSKKLTNLALLFNDHEVLKLHNANGDGQTWSASKQINKPGFYQVLIGDKKSDFYQIEVITDQPVQIRIIKPGQHSTIDVGQPQKLSMDVQLQDDYGIADAYISATVASGKGEAVSFKEQKLSFSLSFTGKKQVNINKLINLKELGMHPGDELYYYIQAIDNHGQQSRSDMYFVSIQDTTELMSLVGIDNGVNLVPEYFRSERQIIIDTEKLLKEKPTITEAEFKKRSNDLGADQKMLRLRYGKFLGEESETNIGGDALHADDHDHAEHGAKEGATESVAEIMDQYAHKHDIAEDATFFEPQQKAQLKATLTEMWNAELRLRTYRPEEALPFEYKALRLLKDLQQKSRAYVAKTTFKTSKIKFEKRLTGELNEIETGLNKSNIPFKTDARLSLEQAISIIENRKPNQALTVTEISTLTQLQHTLTSKATAAPQIYLPALKSLKKIMATRKGIAFSVTDAANVSKGIHALLGKTISMPAPQVNANSSALSKSYFNHLKRSMP